MGTNLDLTNAGNMRELSGESARRRHIAFTLVELLVVIAIVGLLVALLLPAVQSAREAARQTQCKNKLRQLGIALHAYHESHGMLPPGAHYDNDPIMRLGNVLMRLLPMLERQDLFDAFDFGHFVDDQTFADGRLIGQAPVADFVCPSDSLEGRFGDIATFNYSASSGPTAVGHKDPACPASQWNDLAMGFPEAPHFAGPFYRTWKSPVSFRQVTDGLSKTIFFGEVRPACSHHVQRGWAHTNNAQGLSRTLIPLNYDSCDDAADSLCHQTHNWNTEFGFKSQHPGGVHFLFGDVAVAFVADETDQQLLQLLGAKADGQSAAIP